ncbi:MAG: hypothetical protein KJO07_03485, partial [Deltaproteobacteria bacterium]|nr:hypothetical protein [Deltaproteobacteria bacterium]
RFETLAKTAQATGAGPARLAAIAALGRLGGSEAEGVLSGLLDGDGEADEVRAQAFRALRRLQRAAQRAAAGGAQ